MAKNKANMKKFVTGAITATMVASAVAPVAALADTVDFSDVPTDSSHYPNIVKAAERGLMTGYADGTFKPTLTMNRGQVVKALGKYIVGQEDITLDAYLEKHDLVKNVAAFEDVPATHVDQELFKYSLVVKDAQAFTGNQNYLNPTNDITRQQMAKVLVNAFDLKDISDVEADVADMDTVFGEYKEYVSILSKHEVTKADDGKFRPAESVTRQQMASFLNRSYDAVHEDKTPEVPGVEGITSVKAINDTRYEVTFGKAIDADVAREIEKNPGHFVAYDAGSTSHDPNRVATYVSFSSDYKTAEIILGEAPRTDVKYTVALLDSDNAATADVKYASPATVLNVGAEKPSLEVNSDQEKFYLNFKEEMHEDTLDQLGKIKIFNEQGQGLANGVETLADVLSTDTEAELDWVDATTKKEIKFDIEPGKLEAGKKYKVVIDEEVVNKEGEALSASKRSITVTMPSIKDAEPKATLARIVGDTVIVTFDKDLEVETDGDTEISTKLFTVKTSTGKEVTLEGTATVSGKNITLKQDAASANKLDEELTYTVDVPANVVANKVFTNATNPAQASLKAQAQANVAVKSVSAKFERDVKNNKVADLLLTFDQRVKDAIESGKEITIEESGKSFTFVGDASDIEYDTNDSTGKTLRIKDVEENFENKSDRTEKFTVKSNKSYTVKVEKEAIATDSSTAPVNQADLKASINGIDVSAPKLDEITLHSAEKIVAEFDKDIVANGLSASDIKVKGYQVNNDGSFNADGEMLQGSNQIKVSVSGNAITITPANDKVKFVTSEEDFDFWIKDDKIKGKNDVVSSDADLKFDADEIDVIDNAAPVMIGAIATDGTELQITYSEAVDFRNSDAAAGKQFTVEGAEYKNYATTAVGAEDKVITLTFDKALFKTDVDYTDVNVIYKKQDTYRVEEDLDSGQKAAANQTLKSVKNKVEADE